VDDVSCPSPCPPGPRSPRRDSASGDSIVRPKFSPRNSSNEVSSRFLTGYTKVELLGKGGSGFAWLAQPRGTGPQVVVKQLPKGRAEENEHTRERTVSQLLFGLVEQTSRRPSMSDSGGESLERRVRSEVQEFVCDAQQDLDVRMHNVVRTFAWVETRLDVWIVMEHGGTPLSKALSLTKGEFYKGDRVYRILDQPLYLQMLHESRRGTRSPLFMEIARQTLGALDILSSKGIVHADLKPDNLLVTIDGRCCAPVDERAGSAPRSRTSGTFRGSKDLSSAGPSRFCPPARDLDYDNARVGAPSRSSRPHSPTLGVRVLSPGHDLSLGRRASPTTRGPVLRSPPRSRSDLAHRGASPEPTGGEEPLSSRRSMDPLPSAAQRVRIRLVDFGSAFLWDGEGETAEPVFHAATPEYMAPERLSRCALASATAGTPSERRERRESWADEDLALEDEARWHWSIDMWSLGCVLLEIVLGVPLWIAYKLLVTRTKAGPGVLTTGLFAVSGRDVSKILRKQRTVLPKLRSIIESSPGLQLPSEGVVFLEQLLAWSPSLRATPQAALAHPFLCKEPREADGERDARSDGI